MGNFCIWETRKIKGSLNSCMRHNYRLEETKNASLGLSYKNEELVKLEYKDFNDAFKSKINELPYYDSHRVRKDAVRAIEVVLSYSPEADGTFDIDEWKKKSMEWIREKYDLAPKAYGTNIISAVFHGDEARGPHIHAVIIPIDERGHLNAKRYMGNMYNLHQMKESYAEAMGEFGLVAGETRYHNRPDYEKLQDLYRRTDDARAAIPKPLPDELASDYFERSLDSIDAYVSSSVRDGNQKRWELQREAERQADKIKSDALALTEQLKANAQMQIDQMQNDMLAREEALKKAEAELEKKKEELDRKLAEMRENEEKVKNSELYKIGYPIQDVYGMAEEKVLRDRAIEWYRELDTIEANKLAIKEDEVMEMYLTALEEEQSRL